ncbi:c-type cytochrome biogenesis protein CcmI, partial [Oceaniglobus roseus]|uniref:c-type cytochrome biogenesis protein CcmI n=1 Tax=Oceaniglobus roseus TaxID=1737570 RepID=UPI000C7F3155
MFWILATALGAITASLIVLALVRRGRAAPSAAAAEIRIYRDQLDEVERDLARGTLEPEEAERVRLEISRRLLEADRAAAAAAA